MLHIVSNIAASSSTIASTYATSDELDAVAETANAAAKATEVNQALADKADKADLAGYRTIADSYSTSQIDNLLAGIRGEYGETADSVAAELDAHKEANIASFAAIETKQGAQDTAIQANKAAIDAINNETTGILAQALAGSSDATDAKINTLKENDLAALDDRLTAAESDIDTLQSTTGTLSGAVTTIEGNVTDLQGRVSTLETDAGTLVSRIDAHDTSIGELNTAQQTLSDEIDALEAKFDDYSTTTAIETKISEAVATLENGKVAGNTTAIETEASRAVAKETELAGLIQGNTDSIQSLSDEFDALESVLNSVIENEDSTALNSIKELASWIEQHGKEASEMTASITANTNAISVLNGTGEGSVKYIVDTAIENIPAATTNTLGLVKVGNTLTVSNDGLLDVDSITTDQLTQGSNTLVLNGGSATQK